MEGCVHTEACRESVGPEIAHLLPSAGAQVSGQTGDGAPIRGWMAARLGPRMDTT